MDTLFTFLISASKFLFVISKTKIQRNKKERIKEKDNQQENKIITTHKIDLKPKAC